MKKTVAAKVFAAAVLGGAGVAVALVISGEAVTTSASCPASAEALLANRISGLSQSYKKDNPVESAAVFAFLNGGTRPDPSAMTHMGRHLVFTEDDCRALAPPTTTGTTTTTTTTTSPPPPPPSSANVWVDPNGGTCAWSATAVGYTDATACGSLDAAYDAANAHPEASLVYVKAGSYAAKQTMSGDRSSPNRITFDEAPGESVNLGEIILGSCVACLSTDSPDYVTFKGFALAAGLTVHGDATYITLDGIDGGAFSLWGGDHYLFQNSDFGPCASISSPSFAAGKCNLQFGFNNASNEVASGFGTNQITDLQFLNNVVHDFVLYKIGDHYECWRMDGDMPTTHIIVRGNRFYNCQLEAITGTEIGDGSIFENNWVGSAEPTYGCDPFTSTCQGTNRAQSFGCASNMSGTIIYRYNSAASGAPIPDASGGSCSSLATVLSYGNIMDTDNGFTCAGNVTYSYNVHMNGANTCGGVGEVAMAGMPYVNNASGAAGDYHLASGTSAPNNLVPTSKPCVGLLDRDGQVRPLGALCDAGSDEH